MTQPASSRLVSLVGVAVALVALAVVHDVCADSLMRTRFVTGWALLLAIGVQAGRRWRKVRSSEASTAWVGGQGGLVLVTVMLFAMHLDFRIPDGWLDSVLAGMFVLLVASSAVAALLLPTLRRVPRLRTLLFEVEALTVETDPAASREFDGLVERGIVKDRFDAQHTRHQAARRWLLFHVSLTASILTLGAMHGVLAHTHSVLAYIVLGR